VSAVKATFAGPQNYYRQPFRLHWPRRCDGHCEADAVDGLSRQSWGQWCPEEPRRRRRCRRDFLWPPTTAAANNSTFDSPWLLEIGRTH